MVIFSADFAYKSITRRESGAKCTGSLVTLSNITLCLFRKYGWSQVEAWGVSQAGGLDLTRIFVMALFFFKAMIGGSGKRSLRIGSVCNSFQLS